MAKLQVEDKEESTRVPFMRGILTRSLQESGLPFLRAYELSGKVREDLGDFIKNITYLLQRKVWSKILEKLKIVIISSRFEKKF